MKEIKYNSGGQPFYIEDDQLQQEELFKAIEKQFADTNGLVLSGCVVTGSSISAGLVYLDGKVRELASATGLTFPCYIKASAVVEYDSRLHAEDSLNKTTKRAYNAEITNTLPTSGDYIVVTAQGVNKRLQYVVKNDQNGQFTPNGFALNAGKVSYVEAKRTSNQSIVAGFNLVSWESEIDELNEFDVSNSEFVASSAGVYQFNASARINIVHTSYAHFEFQFWNGTGWEAIGIVGRGSSTIQGEENVACCKKLNAGEKVRFVVGAGGTGFSDLILAYLSICRIA